MPAHTKTYLKKKGGTSIIPAAQRKTNGEVTSNFADNRQDALQLKQLQETLDGVSDNGTMRAPDLMPESHATSHLSPAQQVNGLPTTVQRMESEEEDLLQGKFDPVQLQAELEEEELLQGKFDPVQRQGDLEDEELLQGKFDPVQLQGGLEEEELLQGKFNPVQRQKNNTGMPDQLKSGMEQLSGHDLSGVRVHYNSSKPAQLNALAYAQGENIHLSPGQEQHLPHEAWHTVQQMQGRVQPTVQEQGVSINDDNSLEHEADVMGARALQTKRKETE